MKIIKIVVGVILILVAIVSAKDYILVDEKWTEYQKGSTVGDIIIFCIGILLIHSQYKKENL